MIFLDNRRAVEESFQCLGTNLRIVDQYTYLGVVFHKSGNFSIAESMLLAAGKRALHALYGRCKDLGITSIELKCRLFDALVGPILTYASGIWAMYSQVGKPLGIEKLHKSFLQNLVKVRNSVPTEVLMAEFGRLPLQCKCEDLALRYYFRLKELPEGSLAKEPILSRKT